MNHDFEQLGPERFQEFCQSLLLVQYPDLQCFPVGQGDGGRDGLLRPSVDVQDLVVYQVKFKRNPATVRDPVKDVIADFHRELDKIQGLARRGATQYVMLTNLAGTGTLDRGSMDRVAEVLDSLPMPGLCLWRDDLNRRLDSHPELRWSFPELLRGTDVLKLLLEQGLGADEQRRRLAIDAFLVDQYEEDCTVQFKQVDLHSELLDLFVDVPFSFTASSRTRRYRATSALRVVRPQMIVGNLGNNELTHLSRCEADGDEPWGPGSEDGAPGGRDRSNLLQAVLTNDEEDAGAATMLLSRAVQDRYPFICIEGAPGQGKSTLGQYLCQVHRIRLLNRDAEREMLPHAHRTSPLRCRSRRSCATSSCG